MSDNIVDKFKDILQLENLLENDAYGEIKDSFADSMKTHKGTVDDPLPFPHIEYTEVVRKLIHAVYDFNDANPEYDLYNYNSVLKSYGINGSINLEDIDVSEMDDKCLMALFMALVRGERFCDGLILDALQSGSVQKWIKRLKVIVADTNQ